jgi:hypothetical protein
MCDIGVSRGTWGRPLCRFNVQDHPHYWHYLRLARTIRIGGDIYLTRRSVEFWNIWSQSRFHEVIHDCLQHHPMPSILPGCPCSLLHDNKHWWNIETDEHICQCVPYQSSVILLYHVVVAFPWTYPFFFNNNSLSPYLVNVKPTKIAKHG